MDALKSDYKITEVELIYHRKQSRKNEKVVTQSQTSYEILRAAWDDSKIDLVEHFKILLLRQNNACIGVSHIGTGGVSSCVADAKIIFATALKANACQIILSHNHPSGNLKASGNDIALTQQLVAAAKMLDMKVLDHLILTSEGYLSFADEGLMP